MIFFNTIANNTCLWLWYFSIATIISLVVGIAKFREQYVKSNLDLSGKVSHILHFSIYHGLTVAFGFLLIFFLFQLLNFAMIKSSIWNIAIIGILFIIILIASFFCISGRGIEALHKLVMNPGVKKIHISLKKGIISLEFGDKKT